MKSYFKISFLFFVCILVGSLALMIAFKANQKKANKQSITELPNFNFWSLDSSSYTPKNLPVGKKIVVMHFNSTCEHCQYEAQELVKNSGKFSNTVVLLVSEEKIQDIQKFSAKYALNKLSNIVMLKANYNFSQYFGKGGIPDIFIYDNTQKLIKHYKGETKIEAIFQHLN